MIQKGFLILPFLLGRARFEDKPNDEIRTPLFTRHLKPGPFVGRGVLGARKLLYTHLVAPLPPDYSAGSPPSGSDISKREFVVNGTKGQ